MYCNQFITIRNIAEVVKTTRMAILDAIKKEKISFLNMKKSC